MKSRQLQDLLHQLGMSEDAVSKFGMRSFRSGAAGQALVNLTSQSGGVPKAYHYQSLARALGHTNLTRVTMESYIGPLGYLLFDNSAVLFGEEEGVVGGNPDYEARIARLPQYFPFVARGALSNEEMAEKAQERANGVRLLSQEGRRDAVSGASERTAAGSGRGDVCPRVLARLECHQATREGAEGRQGAGGGSE